MHACFEIEAAGRGWDCDQLVLFSRNKGRGVIMVDHVAVRGGVRAPGRAALGLDLQPRLTQGLGEVVVHRARNGHGVCHRFWLLVVLSKTAAKMLLDNRVAGRVS